MILALLQSYLQDHRAASLTQMEASLGVPAEALRGMLDLLERKGRARRLPRPQRCHGCTLCDAKALEFYGWIGASGPGPKNSCGPE